MSEIALEVEVEVDATATAIAAQRKMLVSQSRLRLGSQPWWVELPVTVAGRWASWVRRGVLD